LIATKRAIIDEAFIKKYTCTAYYFIYGGKKILIKLIIYPSVVFFMWAGEEKYK
jgi:hypothetical protein